jgi:glucose/arabinose dehydrogenase
MHFKSHSLLALLGMALGGTLASAGCETTGTTTTGGAGGTGATGGDPTTGGGGGTGGNPTTGGGGTGGNPTTGGGGSGGATGGSGGGVPVGNYDCSPPDGAVPALTLTEVVNGLDRPMYLRAAPGDDTRLFIIEQDGYIRILQNGVINPEPFLDITDRVAQNNDERGFLGLAFHPDYQNNGRFFVFYTEEAGSPGNQTIAEYTRSDNPDLAVAQADGFGMEVQKLLTVADTQGNHNGGMIDFSPKDGYLYIGLGDEGGANDQHGEFGNGLDLTTLWGKILRIDVDNPAGGMPYGIPAGNMTAVPPNNPTQGNVLPEIWDFGLRNPWRFAFDPCSGDLYIGDVGQGVIEEIDVAAAGQGNINWGWRAYEGTNVFDQTLADLNMTVAPPVAEYSHAGGNCSVTGGFIHRSAMAPGLRGRYFYGDYCSGRVWSFTWDGSQNMQNVTEHTQDLDGPGQISSFGYDNFGNVYLVEISGTIHRIDAE